MFIRFTARSFRRLLSIYVFSYFPFGFEGRMWDLIISVPDHCLSFHFVGRSSTSQGSHYLHSLQSLRFVLSLNAVFNIFIKFFIWPYLSLKHIALSTDLKDGRPCRCFRHCGVELCPTHLCKYDKGDLVNHTVDASSL